MNALKVLLILLVSGLTSLSFAGTGSGTVGRIYVHSPDSNLSNSVEGIVLFSVTNHLNPPACSTNEWAFSLDNVRGRMMYAFLLSAKAQGKSVTISGAGVCDHWADRERPHWLMIE
jgi:hypothetical protein